MMVDKYSFIGCEGGYGESGIVIFGAPFDGTASYRPGARFAPAAIRGESYGIETYSPYQDRDLTDKPIYDAGDLELPFGNTEKVMRDIEAFASGVLNDGKIPLMLGGEHLVTLGTVRAAYKKYPGLHIIHFDAHADLRDSYLGEKLSHSTVMRRCGDLLGAGRLFQFGIRSGDREEFRFADNPENGVFMSKFGFSGLSEAVELLECKPVYLTLDLDVLDPSELPGTGTPEAGGVSFKEFMAALKAVSSLNIVAADMCELAPGLDAGGASTALACKLLREILLFIRR